MTDNPNKLKAMLLGDCSTEQKQEFAQMLAKLCTQHDLQATGHRCSFFIPSPTEYERLRKYNQPPNYDKCPKCGKGRLFVEVYKGNLGESWNVVCTRKEQGCDFKEYVSDDV